MAESFADQQLAGQCGAIDGDATMLAARSVLMDNAGQDSFSGSAFSLNQNRRVGPRSFPGELEGFRQCGTVANETVLKGMHLRRSSIEASPYRARASRHAVCAFGAAPS